MPHKPREDAFTLAYDNKLTQQSIKNAAINKQYQCAEMRENMETKLLMSLSSKANQLLQTMGGKSPRIRPSRRVHSSLLIDFNHNATLIFNTHTVKLSILSLKIFLGLYLTNLQLKCSIPLDPGA
jgi:hypothetical protein